MRDYSFLGPNSQFWKLICTEYRRLEATLGRAPFKLEIMGQIIPSLEEYVPALHNIIDLEFYNADYSSIVLVVEAEHLVNEAVLDITLFPQENAFIEKNRSGYKMWDEIVRVLVASGLLTDHRAEILAASHKPLLPPEPPPGSDVFAWLDWRIEMLKAEQPCTLRLIAAKIHLSEQRVRVWHGIYKKQRGLPNGYERQYKKRYKK